MTTFKTFMATAASLVRAAAGLFGLQEAAERFLDRGREALFQGRFDKAIELLEKALAMDGAEGRAIYRLNLARAYRFAGRPADAEKQLAALLERFPEHVEAGQFLAEIYAGEARWKDIQRVLEPLLEYRHDYQSHHLLAEAAFNLGDLGRARRCYEEAIRLNPESGGDHYQLGNIHLAQNRFALAARSYERALGLGLSSGVLHFKLASAYFNLRNYFGQIAEIAVPSGKPQTLHGEYYLFEAVPGREQTFRAAPRRSALYQSAAAIAAGMPDDSGIRLLQANIYLSARRFAMAHSIYKHLEASVPEVDRALFYYSYAQSAFGLGDFDGYLASLQKAVALDPKAYETVLLDAYLKVAERFNQAGRQADYLDYLSRAVQASPRIASLHLKLGDAYAESQNLDKAIEQWRMVLDLEPDHPERTRLLNRIARRR